MLLVSTLTRWLPSIERETLAKELLVVSTPVVEQDNHDENQVAPDTAPDWDHIWHRLLTLGTLVGRTKTSLRDARMYFDLTDLADDARDLQQKIDDAYSLMCKAPRLEGLPLRRGDDLNTVERKVRIRRAEIVDAELTAVRREPTPDATTWMIDYRKSGAFLAKSTSDSDQPSFWGFAPTPQSAANTVCGYFLDHSPAVVFDPPEPSAARPLALLYAAHSDDLPDLPTVHDLLEAQGSSYGEHIAACARARDVLAGRDLRQYLADQAARLNDIDPQLPHSEALEKVGQPTNLDHGGFLDTVQWVQASLIVDTGYRPWGEFGDHRPEVPLDIARGLADATDLHQFTSRFFWPEISLNRIPAWAGPIYRLGANGIHRIHTARMLGLPWLAASVRCAAVPPAWDLLGILSGDLRGSHREPLEGRLQRRAALIEGLIRRGVIDGELITEPDNRYPVLRCGWLPAPWLLGDASYATSVNKVYESRYPGALASLGIPDNVGTDAVAWTDWLNRP